MVDAGPVDRRWRDADLGRHGASVPSSDPARRSSLHELLAWRFRYIGYRRHEPSEIYQRPQLVATLPLADPHDFADPVEAHEPRCDGRNRRRSGQARADAVCIYVDGRHHGRNAAGADLDVQYYGGSSHRTRPSI